MPDYIFDGVTKNDLLKLKNSKAVPITAHSHEVVVPVVYATRVKQFMKREGMRVPLEPEELAALKKKARDTEGTMDASYAVGGTIKGKKKKSKKQIKQGTVIKKGNIKQVVNIKLGSRVIRTPSTRAKVLGKENIPIRPGVSSYPTTTEPSYSRMIPSTGAFTQPTKPQSLMLEDAKPPLSSSVVKPGAMPLVLRPPSIPPPPLMRPPSTAPPSIVESRQRPLIAGQPIPTARKVSQGPAEETSQMMKRDTLMLDKARPSSLTPSPPPPTPAQSRGRAIIAARK